MSENTTENTELTTKEKAAEAGAKLPKDHKVSPEQTDGWNQLKNPAHIKASDQLLLLAEIQDLGLDGSVEGEEVQLDLRALSRFIEFIGTKFAKDKDAFDEWSAGKGGYQRAIELAMAYSGALGE